MKKKNMFKFVEIISAILLISIIILSCTPESDEPSQTSGLLPDQELENTTVNFTRDGQKLALLWTEHLYKYKKSNLVKGAVIKITFFDSLETPSTFLTSDSGKINEKNEHIEVWGDVKIETKDSVKLWTNSLTWDTESQLIETNDYVKIKKGRDIIEGIGLISDIDFNNIRIKKNVKAKIDSGE